MEGIMIEEMVNQLKGIGLDISDCVLGGSDGIVGWLCSYVPEEIIHAAGFQPIRISGRGNPIRRADTLLHTNMCPFVRSVLDDAMEGEIQDLKGMVIANSCDAMRRMFDAWTVFRKDEPLFFLDPPKKTDEMAVSHYSDQLREFAHSLSEIGPRKITDSSLAESIEVFNKTRDLMVDVSRRVSNGSLSSYTGFIIMHMATKCDRRVFNGRLEQFLGEYAGDEEEKPGVRVLLTGCIIDQPDLMKVMEEVGANVVVNELCTGLRQFDQNVNLGGDHFRALAERYLTRAPCARMMDSKLREAYLTNLAGENRIDGVIYYIIKFCDHYMWDFPTTKEAFEGMGIPVLDVEGEYIKGSHGPLKTRLQAFVESLQD